MPAFPAALAVGGTFDKRFAGYGVWQCTITRVAADGKSCTGAYEDGTEEKYTLRQVQALVAKTRQARKAARKATATKAKANKKKGATGVGASSSSSSSSSSSFSASSSSHSSSSSTGRRRSSRNAG